MSAVGNNVASKRRRGIIATLATVTLFVLSGSPSAHASETVVVLDSLGAASPQTTFSVFGSGGQSVFAEQFVGPRFTLSETTVITEIGAFVNNCSSIISGVPQCPDTLPFIVQIRRSVNGVPDPSGALGQFTLSHDDNPLIVSFETTNPEISLGPGEYFALIGSQGEDAGYLLDAASSPFDYMAGLFTMGVLNPVNGTSFATAQYGAVRILGRVKSVVEQLADLALAADQADGPGNSLVAKVSLARSSVLAGEFPVACHTLEAFEFEVRAQRGKSISDQVADSLIADASQIRGALSC